MKDDLNEDFLFAHNLYYWTGSIILNMLKQVHLYIKGSVIGVGFRAWTKIQAKIVGVTGWVRNVDGDWVVPKFRRRRKS